jgi:hypothetical protein
MLHFPYDISVAAAGTFAQTQKIGQQEIYHKLPYKRRKPGTVF